MTNYKFKYIKYKLKYINLLKKQKGGLSEEEKKLNQEQLEKKAEKYVDEYLDAVEKVEEVEDIIWGAEFIADIFS